MRVAKWGNSLAIRIPADVAEKLGVKAGDEVEGQMNDRGRLEISRRMTIEEALDGLRVLPKFMGPHERFDRDDAHGD